MKGNTLNEFMDDLYSMGGPEKEFLYNGKRYFLQCEAIPNSNLIEFEQAKIFDGKTIYEAEKDIEVLFG